MVLQANASATKKKGSGHLKGLNKTGPEHDLCFFVYHFVGSHSGLLKDVQGEVN